MDLPLEIIGSDLRIPTRLPYMVSILTALSMHIRSSPDPVTILGLSHETTKSVRVKLRSDSNAYVKKVWCRFQVLLQKLNRTRGLVHSTHGPSAARNLERGSRMSGVTETLPEPVSACVHPIKICDSQFPSPRILRLYGGSPRQSTASHVDTAAHIPQLQTQLRYRSTQTQSVPVIIVLVLNLISSRCLPTRLT